MSKQITRRPNKHAKRQAQHEEQLRRAAAQKQAARRRRYTIIGIIVAAVLLIGAITAYTIYSNGQTQAETVVNPAYPPVDHIYCDTLEQSAFHIHVHLTMYIDGKTVEPPANMGIASDQSCYYWLHTHDATGVIHIESPAGHSYVLGNFFDEWSTQFPNMNYPAQLDLSGWTAYLNGTLYQGDFHKIPLQSHYVITLMYNSPNAKPDTSYDWNAAGLQQ